MPIPTPQQRAPRAPALTRRRFLGTVGALIGAGTLTPLLRQIRVPGLSRIETSRPALGSWMRVVARADDPTRAGRGIEAAFAAVRRVDAQMSIHRPESQIGRANAAAGHSAVIVDEDVLDVVERAVHGAQRSGGVYDATVLPLMRLYGFYGTPRAALPSHREIARTMEALGSRQVIVDRAAGTLALAREGAGIDLGSIGKGWAVDRAVAAMRGAGVESGLVDVGGNVYGLGTPDDDADGWSVAVFHPATGALDRVFTLRDAAVATSGNTEQSRVLGPVRIGHLFDAHRGTPSNGHLSASVVAANATDADMLSTVAFLTGPHALASWSEVRDAHFIG
jgi:FAD:protein FMN transferase